MSRYSLRTFRYGCVARYRKVSAGARREAQSLLGNACVYGAMDQLQRALDAGADPQAHAFDTNGNIGGTCTAAMIAALQGHGRVLEVLFSRGAEPNKGEADSQSTPIHAACVADRSNAITVLLQHGANRGKFAKTKKVRRIVRELAMARWKEAIRAVKTMAAVCSAWTRMTYAPGGAGARRCVQQLESNVTASL